MNRTAPLVVAAVFALGAAPQFRAGVSAEMGVYLGWVGTYPGDRLKEGARLAKQFGFQTIRVPLVASVETDFGIGSTCHGRASLADLASLPAYANVLSEPAFHAIFLTVWGDSTSYDACDARDPRTDQHPHKYYLDPEYYTTGKNRERMRKRIMPVSLIASTRTIGGAGKLSAFQTGRETTTCIATRAALCAIDSRNSGRHATANEKPVTFWQPTGTSSPSAMRESVWEKTAPGGMDSRAYRSSRNH